MFDSLTDNGKGVLKLIIKEQINQIAKQKEGPTFKGNFITSLIPILFYDDDTFLPAIWLEIGFGALKIVFSNTLEIHSHYE